MKEITIEGAIGSKMVLTGEVMAMYSPQPLIVDLVANVPIRLNVHRHLDGPGTVPNISEERHPYEVAQGQYRVDYEVSRMLQLCFDLDEVLGRVKYDGTASRCSEKVDISLDYYNGTGWAYLAGGIVVDVLFAACDGLEVIDDSEEVRRVWVNYPHSVACGPIDGVIEIGAAADIYVDVDSNPRAVYELDWVKALENAQDEEFSAISAGLSVRDVFSTAMSIQNGQGEKRDGQKGITFKPDLTPWGRGTYLRWLQRDGSVGYWLFVKSKETVAASADKGFTRWLDGVEAAPVGGVLRNSARHDFTLEESWTIGTRGVTEEEFRLLQGLACSPVVERLVGGTRTEPIWQRVNVAAGSYSREYPKSGLRRFKDFELIITLPERNTIKW